MPKQKMPAAMDERIRELLENLELAADRKMYRVKDFFTPYEKQMEFCDFGSNFRERLLSAGNQTGKTEIGAYECACHLTGEYPDWWLGKRWDRPVKAWAAGVTGLSTRDVVQKKLCGEPGVDSKFGTGMIPKECFAGKPTMARGVSDLYDKIIVKHKNGGESVLILKTYEQGREKWQGDTLDFVWFDEEPPQEIYGEGITRLNGDGMAYMTFTPLGGVTTVVQKFFDNPSKDQKLVLMTIDDITHFTDKEKQARVEATPPHLRRSRFYGLPAQGEGAVFPISRDAISEDALGHIPEHWPLLWGIDFGIAHPFAAVLIAWDRDADCIHVVHTVRMSDAMIIQHAAAMKPFGWIKVAWPQDGTQRDRGDLTPMSMQYKKQGLRMLPEHAKFEDGSNSTEAGIAEMLARMQTGRLKVARQLTDWFQEFERYHRKDGLLVKVADDLMSATRVAIMAKRNASIRMPAPDKSSGGQKVALDVDTGVFGDI